MKLATYNLRAGGRRGNRVHWQRMLQAFAPEILLMQETQAPASYLEPDFYAANASAHLLAGRARPQMGQRHLRSLRPVEAAGAARYNGYVVAAEVTGSDWSQRTGRPLRIASLHVPAPYKRPMNEILDYFATLGPRHDWILGGDFNLAVGVRHASEPIPSDPPWLLRRLRREFNLMSCWQTVHPNCDLAQTLRWVGNPALPYHCDGFFVPASWYRHLDDCQVIADPTGRC